MGGIIKTPINVKKDHIGGVTSSLSFFHQGGEIYDVVSYIAIAMESLEEDPLFPASRGGAAVPSTP